MQRSPGASARQGLLPAHLQRAAELSYLAPIVTALCKEAEAHPDLWVALVGSGAMAELAGWAEASIKKKARFPGSAACMHRLPGCMCMNRLPGCTCMNRLPAMHAGAALPATSCTPAALASCACFSCCLASDDAMHACLQDLAWCLLSIEYLLATCCQQLDRLTGSQALPVLAELHMEAVAAAAAGPGPSTRQARGGQSAERGGKSPGGSASSGSSDSSAGASRGRDLVVELLAGIRATAAKTGVTVTIDIGWQQQGMAAPTVRVAVRQAPSKTEGRAWVRRKGACRCQPYPWDSGTR